MYCNESDAKKLKANVACVLCTGQKNRSAQVYVRGGPGHSDVTFVTVQRLSEMTVFCPACDGPRPSFLSSVLGPIFRQV